MYNKLIFFNAYGNGDIFESRRFVKEIMQIIPAKHYFYAHGKSPRILADIPEIQFTPFVNDFDSSKAIIKLNDNSLVWNTWIGRDSKYVLPGIGCTVEKLYEMYNDILRLINLPGLSKPIFDYIPDIDYSYYNIKPIDEFLQKHIAQKVLISNGKVYSDQAVNFDFTPVINKLAEKLPDVIFILTEATDISKDNVFYTSNIINNKDKFDLNEISYLSLFCDTHIGRNSGPHVFAQVRDNWLDPNKVTLSFTRENIASHFVWKLPTAMQKRWSGSTNIAGIYETMYRAVRRL